MDKFINFIPKFPTHRIIGWDLSSNDELVVTIREGAEIKQHFVGDEARTFLKRQQAFLDLKELMEKGALTI